MAGETSLAPLLRSISPQLNPGEYVVCTLADAERAMKVHRQLAANAE